MTTLEALVAARAWLGEGPHRWCQGAEAADQTGEASDIDWGPIAQTSVSGSVDWVLRGCERPDLLRAAALSALTRAAGCDNLLDWNDFPSRSYDEVLAVFDAAIDAEAAG